MCIYIPALVFLHLEYAEKSNETPPVCEFEEDDGLIVNMIDLVNLSLVSCPISHFLTLTTLYYMYRSRRRFTRSDRSLVREQKYAINSIAIDLLNFVCVTPLLISLVLGHFLSLENDDSDLYMSVGFFMYTINASSSFLVNVVVNSIFYAQFWLMIGMGGGEADNRARMGLQLRVRSGDVDVGTVGCVGGGVGGVGGISGQTNTLSNSNNKDDTQCVSRL
jgi:hypothetical protein